MKNILNLKSQTNLSGFYVVYYGSTLNENNNTRGISHLIEHLLCKEFAHLIDDFQRYGISWNAYTSNNKIVFYMTGIDEYVNKYKYEFFNSLLKFNPSQTEFDIEKKIVIEEYKDVFSDQFSTHFENLSRKLYGNYAAIGNIEDLNSISLTDCVDYFNNHLKSPYKIINVSKKNKFNHKLIPELKLNNNIKKYLDYKNPNDELVYEIKNDFKDKSSIISFSKELIKVDDINYVKFITLVLGNGLKSPLTKKIREEFGLVYSIYCNIESISLNNHHIYIGAVTSNENIMKYSQELKDILNNPKIYITEERIDIIKDYIKIEEEKKIINRYNNIEGYLSTNNETMIEFIDNFNMDKLFEIYNKYFLNDCFYHSVDKDEFKND